MRQRLLQVLGTEDSDDGDNEMTDVVRRFWTRAKPLTAAATRPLPTESRQAAKVVDLATWMRSRHPAR
jgi:hypothetical protein